MAKRKMSENSLKNLEKGKATQFNGEFAVNAQKNSVKKRKENQTLAELMKIALLLPNEETGEVNNVAITNALIAKAIKGDVSAYQTIRDTIGEKPTDKQEVIGNLGIEKVFITPKEAKQTDKHIDDVINEQS
jgi:hypothetical protein